MKCSISSRRFFFVLILLLNLTAVPGFSQAGQPVPYYFPGASVNTDIVIANINTQSVTVTVAFYQTSGELNSSTILLEPGKQTRLNPTSVGLTTFAGTIVVTSGLPVAVSASVFPGDTSFDFVYPSQPGTELLVPFAPLDTASIDVNLFNPGIEQAQVSVVMLKDDGNIQSSSTTTLDPSHSTTVSLAATPNTTHLVIRTASLFTGDRPVAANAVIRNYSPSASGAVLRTDFAVVTALPISNASMSTTLPYFATGSDYFTIVLVTNLTNSSQTVSITAKALDGTNVSGTNNPASVSIPAFGSTRQVVSSLFNLSGTGLTTGSITVGGTGPLYAAAAIGNVSEPSLAVLPDESQPITTFAYQLRRQGREFFTGLSFRNSTADRDANLTMWFLNDSGAAISTASTVIPRSQQLDQTLAELFPEAQGNGYILMRSDVPLFTVGLEGPTNGSALGPRQPLFASPNFAPPSQQTFLAVGTVRDQAVGVPGIAIRLSGPVSASTLSDAAGTFVFNDLPPGTYTLTPIPIGYTISPAVRTFTIANSNSRNNDFTIGFIPPTLTSVTPDGVVVNSETTVITIQGANFIASSIAVFEDSEIPTTFISDTQLTAVLDISLLRTSGQVALSVRNKGPAGDFAQSAPIAFIVGNPPPILLTVTGQPNPLLAGKVTAQFRVTVTGSGFTPASQVSVNGAGRPTTFLSATELQATILPSDVITAGFVLITVQNPLSVSSAPFQLPVLYPVPRLTSISPSVIVAPVAIDAQPLQLTANGAGFFQDPNNPTVFATVVVDGTPVLTQFVSTTQLIATVPASLMVHAGVREVSVSNPAPTLVSSDVLPLFVSNPLPVIISINAGPIAYNNANPGETIFLPLIINGADFSPDSVAWVNPSCDTNGFRKAQITTRISSTQIVATIPIRCAGAYGIQVRTPQPGGGISNIATLSVPAAAPLSSGLTESEHDMAERE